MTFINTKRSPVEFNPQQHTFFFTGEDLSIYLSCGTSEGVTIARLKKNLNHAVWVSIKPVELEDTLIDVDDEPPVLPNASVPGPPDDWKLDDNGVPTLTKEESYRLKRRTFRRVARKIKTINGRSTKQPQGKKGRPGRQAFTPQVTD